MINWDILLTGLAVLLFGLIGLYGTNNRKEWNTSRGRAYGTSIVLLILGIFAVIWSLISD